MKKTFALLLLTLNFSALAGDKIGNGGDVIVCPDERTLVLDIYQGTDDWGFIPVKREGTRQEIIMATLQNFGQVDPFIASKFLSRALEIEKELSVLESNEQHRSKLVKLTKNDLVNISDEGIAELPPGCAIIQAATQNQSPFPGEVKFTFQKKLWLSLDKDVQASLILHETIYEHLISVGEMSSRSTRYLNSALHSGHLDTVKEYFDVSSLFGFKNLAIGDDGKIRVFGPEKTCKVKRAYWDLSGEAPRGGTTIMVGRRNVVTGSENFNEALRVFWQKYVDNGACD